MKLTTVLYLMLMLRVFRSIPALLCTSSWHGI